MIANTGSLSALRTTSVEQAPQQAAVLRQEALQLAQKVAVAAKQPDAPTKPAVQPVSVDVPEIANGHLQLSIDRQTGRVVGRIVDRKTGELLWQVPTEEMLRLIAATKKFLGPLFSTKA